VIRDSKTPPLTDEELALLERAMAEHHPDGPLGASNSRLHGFFTSILSGPLVLPSEWLPLVFGDDEQGAWESLDNAQSAAIALLMRFYNEVATGLANGSDFPILVDVVDGPDGEDIGVGEDWCIGYVIGTHLRKEAWSAAFFDKDAKKAIGVIVAFASTEEPIFDPLKDATTYRAMLAALPVCAAELYEWWRERLAADPFGRDVHVGTIRRQNAKIGPNAPCPCGSGKKYKKCCSPVRVATHG
jgi:uncharacterized protein